MIAWIDECIGTWDLYYLMRDQKAGEAQMVWAAGGISVNNTKEPWNYDDLNIIDKQDVYEAVKGFDDPFAYAVKVEGQIADDVKAEAAYQVKQKGWQGNGNNSTSLNLKAIYDPSDEWNVTATLGSIGLHRNAEEEDNRVTTIGLDGTYQYTNNTKFGLGASYKIEKDKLDLPQIGTTTLSANASALLSAGFATGNFKVAYSTDNLGAIEVGKYVVNPAGFPATSANRAHSAFALASSLFEAELSARLTPTGKLVLTPAVVYKTFGAGHTDEHLAQIKRLRDGNAAQYNADTLTAGQIVTLKLDATYAVGSGVSFIFAVGDHLYNFTEINGAEAALKYHNPFASATVRVSF